MYLFKYLTIVVGCSTTIQYMTVVPNPLPMGIFLTRWGIIIMSKYPAT